MLGCSELRAHRAEVLETGTGMHVTQFGLVVDYHCKGFCSTHAMDKRHGARHDQVYGAGVCGLETGCMA